MKGEEAAASFRPTRWDVAAAAVMFAAAALLGTNYVRALRETNRLADVTGLQQQLFGAAVMKACGRGLTTPVIPMTAEPDTPAAQKPLIEFLTQRRERIDCRDIPDDVPTAAVGGMQGAAPYLQRLLEAPWAVAGPTWRAVDWLAGSLFGITIALAYLFGATVAGRVGGALIAAAFLLSPLHLSNVGDVRDYSKAPFFAATLLIVAHLIGRPLRARSTLVLATAGGALAGVGFGVRTDVALNLVLVVLAAVIFLPGALASTWWLRLAAGAAAIAAFALLASPVLATPSSGSNAWHWALLGYGHDFDDALGVAPAAYETGYFYDDSYVASIVDAYRGRTTGAADRASVDMPAYTSASAAYYRLVTETFPADALLRCEAALLKVIRLPFAASAAVPSGSLPFAVEKLIAIRSRLLAFAGRFALALFAGVILVLATRNLRVAIAVVTIIVILGAYPAIQFQTRHIFHLELVPLTLLGLVVRVPFALRPVDRTQWIRAAVFAAILLSAATLPLAALRFMQHRSATALLARYEGAALAPIVVDRASAHGVVGLADAGAILPPDAGLRSMLSEQVMVETASQECGAVRVPVTFRYRRSTQGFDYSRTFDLPAGTRAGQTRVYFPLYVSGRSSPMPHHFVFDRIEVPAGAERCVTRVARFVDPDSFPLLIPAVLPSGWRDLPLHQTLRGLERPSPTDAMHD